MSAAFLVILVGAWVVVLVPMWLNRHEAATEVRSVDRFSTAMRILSLRPSWRHEHAVLMPARAYPRRPIVDNELLPPSQARRSRPSRDLAADLAAERAAVRAAERAARAGRARLLARRRRMMTILTVLIVVTAVLAGLGLMPLWGQLVIDIAAFVYLVHVRNQARLARERRELARSIRNSPIPMYRPVVDGSAAGSSVAPRAGEHPSPVLAAPSLDRGAALGAPARSTAAAASTPATSAAGTAGGNRWEPVAVPLPTYVSKPRAPRRPAASAGGSPITIDLTRPGRWSQEHIFDDTDRTDLAEFGTTFDDDQALDNILARRRAVGD